MPLTEFLLIVKLLLAEQNWTLLDATLKVPVLAGSKGLRGMELPADDRRDLQILFECACPAAPEALIRSISETGLAQVTPRATALLERRKIKL